jgi:hypothetical protein
MAVNVSRFSKDLDRLVDAGVDLKRGMILDIVGAPEFEKSYFEKLSKADAKKAIAKIPDFKNEYDGWYSEALVLIKQLLPDRLENFRSFYEKPKTRKEINYGNYVIQDFMQSLVVTQFGDTKVDRSAALPQFRQQLSILRSAKRRLESSLFEMRQLVQADLFDSEIDAARELLKNNFLRAAGAVAGVVLEKHLAQVCEDHGIKIKKAKPGIAVLNQELRNADVIDLPQWRFNQHLADIRNICDHAKGNDPTRDQVQDLLDGTAKVLKVIA